MFDVTDCTAWQDTFIVDNREEGIWVWVGKNATKQERSSAMKYAMELIKTKGYSAKTEVTKVNENGESTEFRGLFASWKLEKEEKSMESRLFRLTRNGTFAQVIQYEQDDLEEDSIMILGKKQHSVLILNLLNCNRYCG